MRTFARLLIVSSLLFAAAAPLSAQTAVDPSGHWEGGLQAGPNVVNFELDLAKNAKGEFSGSFGQPEKGIRGLPISTVAVSGSTVRVVVKGGTDATTFQATLSADGKSMSGEATQAGASMPFMLTRKGDARLAAAPKNAAIGKELEGTWNGTLEVEGRQEHLVLKLANRPDGTAVGTIVDLDGSGVEIPIAITHKAPNVTIEVPMVGASYAAVLKAAELTGTWTQSSITLPVTFTRAAK